MREVFAVAAKSTDTKSQTSVRKAYQKPSLVRVAALSAIAAMPDGNISGVQT